MVMENPFWKGKKVLITGNSGFKGSWLSLWLLSLGAKVVGLSKDIPSTPSLFEVLDLETRCSHHWGDIREFAFVRDLIDEVRPDFLFHLAAQAIVSKSYDNPLETISTNVLGTANILEALRVANRSCVAVIITSDKCYDNVEWEWGYRENDRLGGKDVYSGSKGAAELVSRSYFESFFRGGDKVRIATARAGNVIGGGDWANDRIVADCMRAWSVGDIVTIRCPNATRPWQHVLEPLSGYLELAQALALRKELWGESFNFGPDEKNDFTVLQLLRDLSASWSQMKKQDYYQVVAGTKFHEAGLLKLNCDKARFHLKWQPTLDYPELIEFTSKWYQEYYQGYVDMYQFTSEQINSYQIIANNKEMLWAK
jgi:CDP-glucose 4,6-dehydratase